MFSVIMKNILTKNSSINRFVFILQLNNKINLADFIDKF